MTVTVKVTVKVKLIYEDIPTPKPKCTDLIIYLNVRGLLLSSNKTKYNQLRDMARLHNVYEIVITETWLTMDIMDA